MSIKEVMDALKKSDFLKECYETAKEMHYETEEMFDEAYMAFKNNDTGEAEKISEEDARINELEIELRKKIMIYLANNSSPDLNLSLSLISVSKDYERIGDYCKNIAQLQSMLPVDINGDGEYIDLIEEMHDLVKKEIRAVHDAGRDEDPEIARECGKHYEELKEVHSRMIGRIKENKEELAADKATVYGLITTYLRRIGAHLHNISTWVINPFPQKGFEKGKYD